MALRAGARASAANGLAHVRRKTDSAPNGDLIAGVRPSLRCRFERGGSRRGAVGGWFRVRTWLNETGFVGEYGGLGAVAEVELGENAVDVRLDGGFADDQRGGDFCVGAPSGN